MAGATWTAKIISVAPNDSSVVVVVNYYDATDTSFLTMLGNKTFTFPCTISAGAASTEIVKMGKAIRTAYDATSSFVGTTVNVP